MSFSNPNYHLDPADDNRNQEVLDDSGSDEDDPLYDSLDAVCKLNRKPSIKSRRSYAQLKIESMGVDLNTDPADALENQCLLEPDNENNITTSAGDQTPNIFTATLSSDDNDNVKKYSNDNDHAVKRQTNSFLDYYLGLEAASLQLSEPSFEHQSDSSSENHIKKQETRIEVHGVIGDRDEVFEKEIPHIQGSVNNDLYAVPMRKKIGKTNTEKDCESLSHSNCLQEDTSNTSSDTDDDLLPPGWEKHEDDSGPYYWHISSGTIQREAPPPLPLNERSRARKIFKGSNLQISDSTPEPPSRNKSIWSSVPSSMQDVRPSRKWENQIKRRSYPQGLCSLTPDKKPIRFAVRSLGWMEIAEEDLTPERSSKAVNKCIVNLSVGRNAILDVVGRWGEGKDLYMDLDDYCLRLVHPQDMNVLNTQPIHTIRVWGVGHDNGRDFAYVARDRSTRKHMCHVFRCDIPARIIANTLRDICKKIMLERSLQHNLAKPVGGHETPASHTINHQKCTWQRGAVRPTELPVDQRRLRLSNSNTFQTSQSFPTPMEEPKKRLKAHYVGTTPTLKATGIDVLNCAIDELVALVPPEEYQLVNIAVAPSTISIAESGDEEKILVECRVRFLSFLGIGRDVKYCGFIMHTADDKFMAYVFYSEPSTGALCKTIEAACKLRYQKCLDAHREVLAKRNAESQNKVTLPFLESLLMDYQIYRSSYSLPCLRCFNPHCAGEFHFILSKYII
ncbi:protein Fe65 homolog isoform X2 [Tachypleus tridentatus]|uniref:protein Fe65 homolog isoform X2 n=1 Tax=Tachypleus tridentatus TaxID=6853 RepID=UPI003FD44953